MMTWHKRKFAILFLMCHIVSFTESRYRDKERKRGEKYGQVYTASILPSTSATINLCSRDRDMKLLCYCSPDDIPNIPVTKADCWIFHKDFHQNDSTWQAFQQQTSLRHLKFTIQQTGYMDYIPSKYIALLGNLTTLSIEYSQILEIKGYALGNLSNLELITLTHNQIEMIERDAFANHIVLKKLNLMHNQIVEIDRGAFRNLPELEKLYLSINNMSILHEGVFSELGKLSELKLDQNLISVLTRDMFKGLGNLRSLKLSRNNLNFIGDTVFAELWSLQELELDDNRIERISERALDGLNNLKTLNLRNNRLKKMDNGVLRGVPALVSINLQENLLETLTYYNVQPIMDNLVNSSSELSLSDNKFICDCRLSWVFELRNRTRNPHLRNSLEEIECKISGKEHVPPHSSHELLSNVVDGKGRERDHDRDHERQRERERERERRVGMVSSNIHRDGSDMEPNESLYDIQSSYYDDEAPPFEFDGNPGHIVELFKFTAESLPCPEELSDPTELPLSRESIGMDVRSTLQSSSSQRIQTITSLCVTLVFVSSIFSTLGQIIIL